MRIHLDEPLDGYFEGVLESAAHHMELLQEHLSLSQYQDEKMEKEMKNNN